MKKRSHHASKKLAAGEFERLCKIFKLDPGDPQTRSVLAARLKRERGRPKGLKYKLPDGSRHMAPLEVSFILGMMEDHVDQYCPGLSEREKAKRIKDSFPDWYLTEDGIRTALRRRKSR